MVDRKVHCVFTDGKCSLLLLTFINESVMHLYCLVDHSFSLPPEMKAQSVSIGFAK